MGGGAKQCCKTGLVLISVITTFVCDVVPNKYVVFVINVSVICNHGPTASGNSGEGLEFSSSILC